MNCPIDNQLLTISERQGIEIDYCSHCRGVWLDRGELDKLIERSGTINQQPSRDNREYDDRARYDDRQSKPKKRESFLGDLFDF